jgi:hypothetical protein
MDEDGTHVSPLAPNSIVNLKSQISMGRER